MSPRQTKTRFAPSPTGELHLGNLRTALFNALLARHAGGRFLLRIEDSDRERSRAETLPGLLEDLRWLGLAWDEGPEREGERGPYFQSRRLALYAPWYQRLLEQGDAYPCYCTDAELAAERERQRRAGRPPGYAGTCRDLDPAQRRRREAEGRPAALRFRVPRGREIRWRDLVRGPQAVASDSLADFVVRRRDGGPAFLFCNAVDDALMGVTQVLRGEDHLANTPRQLLLLAALGLEAPAYGHLALIHGTDGRPLSKRSGALGIAGLRRRGYLPGALLNHLVRLGMAWPQAGVLSLAEMAAGFDPARLGRAPARHDPAQLDHWQAEAVRAASDEELLAWLLADTATAPALGTLAPERQRAFVALVRDNLLLPENARHWLQVLDAAADTAAPEPAAAAVIRAAGDAFFATALALAGGQADFAAFREQLARQTGCRGRRLFEPLRAALSGQAVAAAGDWHRGPELARLWAWLGPERAAVRLRRALALARAEE